MPVTFDTTAEIETAKRAKEVYCNGVNIRIPRDPDTPANVTFYFEMVDANGDLIKRVSLAVPLADLATKYPAEVASLSAGIKAIAYQEGEDAGHIPAGGTVS